MADNISNAGANNFRSGLIAGLICAIIGAGLGILGTWYFSEQASKDSQTIIEQERIHTDATLLLTDKYSVQLEQMRAQITIDSLQLNILTDMLSTIQKDANLSSATKQKISNNIESLKRIQNKVLVGGVVIDEWGKPVKGATVTIPEVSTTKYYTSTDGAFFFHVDSVNLHPMSFSYSHPNINNGTPQSMIANLKYSPVTLKF